MRQLILFSSHQMPGDIWGILVWETQISKSLHSSHPSYDALGLHPQIFMPTDFSSWYFCCALWHSKQIFLWNRLLDCVFFMFLNGNIFSWDAIFPAFALGIVRTLSSASSRCLNYSVTWVMRTLRLSFSCNYPPYCYLSLKILAPFSLHFLSTLRSDVIPGLSTAMIYTTTWILTLASSLPWTHKIIYPVLFQPHYTLHSQPQKH